MLRRVIKPMALAVGVWAATWLVQTAWYYADYYTMDAFRIGEQTWTLPVLPDLGWLVFVAVFVAVRICGSRAGSRRECIGVGLSPMILAALVHLVFVAGLFGLSAFGVAAGSMSSIMQGRLTVAVAVMVRNWTADLLGLAGTCLAATWLHFWLATGRGRHLAADGGR